MVIKYAYYIALGWLIFLSVISNLIAWLNNHTMLAIFFL
ncbi:putative membrane protein [Carnobacterium maltaromaticum LMA28]|uniref:Membrane protein n=1 Tax=Carnobacterium maltaromaticum LMA28 TaxID=1234679 RepID=K8E2R0_CARML|nr:putative membrane protein [Carnobacterium maltaromaticum LMA28]